MFVTTILAPAVTISIAILLIVAITLRPRLRRSAFYAVPDELRGINIQELIAMLLIIPAFLSISLLAVYEWPLIHESDILTDIISILLIYIISSLGDFYLSFKRGLFAYYFIIVGFFIDIVLLINFSKSPLIIPSFILYYFLILPVYFTLRTSAIALLSFYNLSMVFFLSTYTIAVFIYYDMNFGRIIPWSLPLQLPVILPEISSVILPVTVVLVIMSLPVVFSLAYFLAKHAPAMMMYRTFWPPLWWWFGLGVFALDELSARSHLHRLSACGTVVVKLSRGERALVISADLYGMYLCRFGRRRDVCNNVEFVGYDELKVEDSWANTRGIDGDSVWRFLRKVVLPIFAGVSVFLTIKYSLIFAILIILSLVFYYIYYKKGYIDNDARELEEYRQAIKRDKELSREIGMTRLLWSLSISSTFSVPILRELIVLILIPNRAVSWDVLALRLAVFVCVFFIAMFLSVLLRADPRWSRYLFPWLELRLMSVDGLVIALARGGCLRRAKVGVAPLGHDIVIRDGDCEVEVMSPYVGYVKSCPKFDLCGPACPPLRIIGGERVVVRVKDGQKEYCYYIADSTTTSGKSVRLFEYLALIWRRILGMRRGQR
jgi:hypothetical protein